MNIKHDLLSITPPPPTPPLFGCGDETSKHVSGFADNAKARQKVSCSHIFEMLSRTFAEILFIFFMSSTFSAVAFIRYDVHGVFNVKADKTKQKADCFLFGFQRLRFDSQTLKDAKFQARFGTNSF